MRTERGFDRIINFSDATVAIAMTLLVLPLVELGGQVEPGDTVWDLLVQNGTAIVSFVLGFVVIWTMWVRHHRILEYFADYDQTVLGLHLLWLLTMVSIPFTTELLSNPRLVTHGATTIYVAVLLVSSVSLHLLGRHGRRHHALLHQGPEVTQWLAAPFRWTTPVIFVVILVVVTVLPGVGTWPLLLLFADGLVESRITRLSTAVRR